MVMRDAETQYWAVEPGPRTGWQPRPLRQAEPVGEASHAPDVGDRRHTGIDGERQAWQPAPIPPYNFTPDLTQVTGPQIEEPEIGGRPLPTGELAQLPAGSAAQPRQRHGPGLPGGA